MPKLNNISELFIMPYTPIKRISSFYIDINSHFPKYLRDKDLDSILKIQFYARQMIINNHFKYHIKINNNNKRSKTYLHKNFVETSLRTIS